MFGILTKKDKRIMELENELERLKFKPPLIQVEPLNIARLRSMVDIQRGIPLPMYKDSIAIDLIKKSTQYINYKVGVAAGKEVLIGELKVVQPSEGEIEG